MIYWKYIKRYIASSVVKILVLQRLIQNMQFHILKTQFFCYYDQFVCRSVCTVNNTFLRDDYYHINHTKNAIVIGHHVT